MDVEGYHLPDGVGQDLPAIMEREQEQVIRIPFGTDFINGKQYQIDVQVRIRTSLPIDQYLVADAVLVTGEAETLGHHLVVPG